MAGAEVSVGDRVVVAVTSYRSGKLTFARVEEIVTGGWVNGRTLDYAVVKTIPGNRRTRDDVVLLAPEPPQPAPFECPINFPGCARNCGSYGGCGG